MRIGGLGERSLISRKGLIYHLYRRAAKGAEICGMKIKLSGSAVDN